MIPLQAGIRNSDEVSTLSLLSAVLQVVVSALKWQFSPREQPQKSKSIYNVRQIKIIGDVFLSDGSRFLGCFGQENSILQQDYTRLVQIYGFVLEWNKPPTRLQIRRGKRDDLGIIIHIPQ